MTSLKDNLPTATLDALESVKEKIQRETHGQKKKKANPLPPVEVGNIYKIEADERNGITPPPGRKTWFKHFAVMGIADDGSLMGCVVFDSEMNHEHIEPSNEEFYIPISKGKYTFIKHDSYLECMKLKPATLYNIRHGKAEGRLKDDDLQKALELTKKSQRNTIVTLRAYNIK